MRGNSKWDINVQQTLILSEVQGSAVAHYSSLTGRYITLDNQLLWNCPHIGPNIRPHNRPHIRPHIHYVIK